MEEMVILLYVVVATGEMGRESRQKTEEEGMGQVGKDRVREGKGGAPRWILRC